MKIQSILFFTFIMLFVGTFKAQQNNSKWIPVLISNDGTNSNAGVEVTYSLTTCNSSDYVLLQFVNTNNYAVKTQWINQIVTKDGKDSFGNSNITFMALPPNSTTIGSCSGTAVQLMVKLSDFGVQVTNFDTFVGSNFYVSK